MKAIVLAVALAACARPIPLQGSASGAAKSDSQAKPAKVVPLSGTATAAGKIGTK